MRIVFYTLLFIGLFSLSFCNDCGDFPEHPKATGIQFITTDIVQTYYEFPSNHIDSFGVRLSTEFSYAIQNKFSWINEAYACEPAFYGVSLSPFIDSISVFSSAKYIEETYVTPYLQLSNKTPLSDFNDGSYRYLEQQFGSGPILSFNQKPENSDSFSFKFYFYKNGQVLDSSATQPFFIAN
jgi:hypothetical protein